MDNLEARLEFVLGFIVFETPGRMIGEGESAQGFLEEERVDDFAVDETLRILRKAK